mmetsp:Transcript_4494/g.10779  ORF Transcript_4494/g.10779 Transcript_4494/m.10779 type:complete len:105 (+) Transcript_4494:34-348(+)
MLSLYYAYKHDHASLHIMTLDLLLDSSEDVCWTGTALHLPMTWNSSPNNRLRFIKILPGPTAKSSVEPGQCPIALSVAFGKIFSASLLRRFFSSRSATSCAISL